MAPRMQVAFRHDTGWSLRLLIARVTGAPCHCVTIFGDTVYDATFVGLKRRTRDERFRDGVWEIIDVPHTYDTAAALALAERRVGWRYDWFGVIVAWWAGRGAGSGHHGKLFCSEQCADELRAAGVPLFYGRSAWYTPRRLRDELRGRGFTSRPLLRAAA